MPLDERCEKRHGCVEKGVDRGEGEYQAVAEKKVKYDGTMLLVTHIFYM